MRIKEKFLTTAYIWGKIQELRQNYFGDVIQPRTVVTEYNNSEK